MAGQAPAGWVAELAVRVAEGAASVPVPAGQAAVWAEAKQEFVELRTAVRELDRAERRIGGNLNQLVARVHARPELGAAASRNLMAAAERLLTRLEQVGARVDQVVARLDDLTDRAVRRLR